MARSCSSVRGCASGSASAATAFAASSSGVGSRIGRLDVFDIVLHLATQGTAQADDPPYLASIDKGHVVKGVRLRCERDHPQLVIAEALIHPYQRSVPIEPTRQSERYAVPRLIDSV